jgi:hypothetical protein
MDAAVLLADVVLLVHFGFLAFVVLGGFLGLRDVRWLVPHGAVVLWAVAGEIHALPCPLTALQKWLIERGGHPAYSGPFIDHYLAGRLYPAGAKQLAFAVAAATVLTSYVVVIVHRRRIGDENHPEVV